MKNKDGFISTSLVYSFLILFLFLMMSIINCYLKKNIYLEALDKQVSEDIDITKDAKSSLFSTILEDNVAIPSYTVKFNNISNETAKNGNGLFYIEDKTKTDENNDGYGSKIYYFRGTVDNNYVVFGAELKRNGAGKVTEHNKICWRIIRTNEDSSIRLLYNGLQQSDGSCSSSKPYLNLKNFGSEYSSYIDSNSKIQFNTANTDNAYVGYTYGEEITNQADEDTFMNNKTYNELYLYTHYHDGTGVVKQSNIKTVLDNYLLNHTNLYYSTENNYKDARDNLIQMADNRMANSVFCNDRYTAQAELHNGAQYLIPVGITGRDSYGYGISNFTTVYEGHVRLVYGEPTYVCNQSIDRYTLRRISGGTNQNHNALAYSIGLPTADDIMFAGGKYNTENTGYFMKTNQNYWTMTPQTMSFESKPAQIAIVTSQGKIETANVDSYQYLRPVISINGETLVMSGSGLINEPYILN